MKAPLVFGFVLSTLLMGCDHQPEQGLVPSLGDSVDAQEVLFPNGNVPATAYLQHGEVYNPESVIPPQCYTKTDGVNNPCFACHQSYPRSAQ